MVGHLDALHGCVCTDNGKMGAKPSSQSPQKFWVAVSCGNFNHKSKCIFAFQGWAVFSNNLLCKQKHINPGLELQSKTGRNLLPVCEIILKIFVAADFLYS